MTIQDDTGIISVYDTYSADGSINYSQMTEKPYKGNEVLLHCILQNYNGTKDVKNARLIEFKVNDQPIDESAYTASTIANARKAAKSAKVKVEGVVAKITYANGMIPSGVMLADSTGSIYAYDGDIAARVKEGNKITILAEKDYWILDSEQNNAAKFGYKGFNQLASAVFVSNDNSNHVFDKKWIKTATVKDILEPLLPSILPPRSTRSQHRSSRPPAKELRDTHSGTSIPQMALANLGRNRSRTIITFISLSLAVVLLNLTFTFTSGFDMDKSFLKI